MEARIERYYWQWRVCHPFFRRCYLNRSGRWEGCRSEPMSNDFRFWTREDAEETLALRVLRDYAEQAR